MKTLIAVALFLIIFSFSAYAGLTRYVIEVAGNDTKFFINGELFEAKTNCLGWEEGDKVVFIEGSASGSCTSALLFNISKRDSCEVWCE